MTLDHPAAAPRTRRGIPLGPEESLRLLGAVALGRIVFSRQALPTVRPVSHVLDGGDIVIRTHDGADLTPRSPREGAARGVVVAYEADDIDPRTHLGWSVVATGYATPVTDPGEIARFSRVLASWGSQDTDCTIRVRPRLVHGLRVVRGP
ncbi:pyridoxamine 5'-phosphate oxidase family protein [Streptomyces sp. NPDC007088]|uniref:pyridoxamine 5'-phosphate oxidase family protein n=1 Tax=Streptomyces sp. NPDC007088 TaxID=3364773 RepID=UPI00369EDEE5